MNGVLGVRERTEDYERASLSTWATLAGESKGRDRYEEPDALRTCFQQDRDRILHSRAFRRLDGKRHVYTVPPLEAGGDHVRTRLIHSLQVAQLARTIGRALRLNEDLIEAIALGHGLGATAFGAAGEEALSLFTDVPFRYHEQSLRVVERVERAGRGLNLTWEVRDGILNHAPMMPQPTTLEGQAVRVAGRLATAVHDIDDAVRAGLLAPEELPAELGRSHGQRVSAMVTDVVTASLDRLEVRLSPRVEQSCARLAELWDRRLEQRPTARAERDRAVHCLRSLAIFYLDNSSRLPAEHRAETPPVVGVLDYVSGMTDSHAVAEFRSLFLPSAPARG